MKAKLKERLEVFSDAIIAILVNGLPLQTNIASEDDSIIIMINNKKTVSLTNGLFII
ncbi:hypothetical protein FC56_GL000970 [Lentilactobacillus senioris DSM 24302 = JCM 17472]|uniref:Uncharacterized protein n=1 Tax=Lentilactobacillus senioris DSM 24302 = JCM 17472 TaxID=1423802 RepID=A0A0R2CNZ7_9LACO|nr:hypothetical protein [Lentilactobacillus senioris]KRM93304.1 hypothetical protein FC56_GL000970 [Lentilactobacillus senioris DSM 24302 = JCM 17472]